MSQDGKCQKANIPFLGCWLKVSLVQEGKCPERQLSRVANVSWWQMESGKCPKNEKKKQLHYKRQMSQVAKSTTVIEKRQKVKGKWDSSSGGDNFATLSYHHATLLHLHSGGGGAPLHFRSVATVRSLMNKKKAFKICLWTRCLFP